MSEIVEISELDLQETVEREERKGKRLVDFMREKEMDIGDHRGGKWKIFKQRLGLKKMSCCGASWSFKANSNMEVRDEEEEEVPVENAFLGPQIPATGMNLAAALAAEREFRAEQEWEGGGLGPTGPTAPITRRVSLIRLLEEANGGDEERMKEKEVGNDSVCCVCMGRKKGAAFIPCGHTFCRVCSREIWLNRGCCPLCNRSIDEILDIF